MSLTVFRFFVCVVLVALVSSSPLRIARNADVTAEISSNSIEPPKDDPKQDLVPAETFWGPGPFGPPPPWAWGPGPFGPFGPGPFGPFGPFGGPSGPGFGPFGR